MDAPASAPLTPDEKKLAASLSQAYGMIGIGVMGLGARLQDPGLIGTGSQTVEMADGLSVAWVELARKNAKVKAYLKKIVEASAAGVLVGMHVALLTPLLASRGVLPASMMGAQAQETADVFTQAWPMGPAENGNGNGHPG